MAPGVLARLPDLTAIEQLRINVGNGVSSLSGNLAAMGSLSPGSPLGEIAEIMGNLRGRLAIDASGLTERLPNALTTMENAVPAGAVDFVKSIEGAYSEAQSFLRNTEIARFVGDSPSLQQAALAAISDLLQGFEDRVTGFTGKLIDPAVLQRVEMELTTILNLRTNFDAHQGDLLPFLTDNLLGVGPQLLKDPLAHVNAVFSLVGHFDPVAIEAALGGLRRNLENAFFTLTARLETLDPAAADAYAQIQAQLDAVAAASEALRDALLPFYRQVQTAVDSTAWDALFSTLETMLRAITIAPAFSVGDLITWLSGALNELTGRLQTVFGPADLAQRIQALNKAIRDGIAGSILGQIREVLNGFLDRIRQAIEAVPTEKVQETVQQMLGRVKEEIDNLNLTQIGAAIEQQLQEAEQFITDHINAALADHVKSGIDGLLQNLKSLPVQAIGGGLTNAVARLRSLIEELEAEIQAGLDQLNQFLGQLDEVTFKPVGDEVIAEIGDLKARLQAINPNALSDVEKLALKAALAVLQGIDLEGKVNAGLKSGLHAAGGELKGLLNDLGAVLGRLDQQIRKYEPQQLIGRLLELFDKALQITNQINGRLLLAPLYREVDELAAKLDSIAPGRILDPLETPYQRVVSAAGQLDPARITAPLGDLYKQIDQLIGFIDLTPLLEELDRREKAMLASARGAILAAFDRVDLPGPLSGFLTDLRPVIEVFSDAVFGSPDDELKKLALELPKRIRLTSLFNPLDKVFAELLLMVRSIPPDALTDAMNSIRQSIGVGLGVIDPRNIIEGFRAAQGLLAEASPWLLLGMPLSLPSLKIQFQARVEGAPAAQQAAIASTLLRFDAAIAVTQADDAQSPVSQLIAAHRTLEDSLRRRINALNASGAEAAYGDLRNSLDRLLPGFLRSPQPLVYGDILSGLDLLRPSRQAAPVEDLVADFLSKLEPMQQTVQPALDDFFQVIRDTANLLSPLAIKDAAAAVYEAIRQKLRILDPQELAGDLRTSIFDPLMAALGQVDPAQWKQRLDAVFQRLVQALTTNIKLILDDIVGVIDSGLQLVRDQINALAAQLKAVVASLAQGVQEILDKVEHLVFIDILDRLRKLIENLEANFDQELDRVRAAFDDMLAAIPLGGSGQTASASVG